MGGKNIASATNMVSVFAINRPMFGVIPIFNAFNIVSLKNIVVIIVKFLTQFLSQKCAMYFLNNLTSHILCLSHILSVRQSTIPPTTRYNCFITVVTPRISPNYFTLYTTVSIRAYGNES